ncbi:hypothetical protein OPW33_01195 [Vibrio europaeus]|jgi:hypothetical protein|uniref:hypothetical protein n=1 Tax=Vibrio europaeus TaxID=300876 RepID=UPI002340F9EB|nr:hypothetical protein [Vibrio europaeus]MDC5837942.1 hypothetical protein [Vibrio europaeus]
MWNSASTNSSTAKSALLLGIGALSFNTYADIDLDAVIESQYESVYQSNIQGNSWSSVGINIQEDNQAQPEIMGISDIVDMVKVSLGLPNKDIASIFRVSRPTLNTYKKSTDGLHTVNATNRERALLLANITQEIQPKFLKSPGAMAKNYVIDGRSLLDLMSDENLDVKAIVQLSDAIAEKMAGHAEKATQLNEISLNQLTKSA